jgi:hypothetical protein
MQTQLNGRSSSTDKFYQTSNALSISPVPGKSSDVSLKVNEDNVQTQNGRSSSTNKLYPVSNELPISSGPRKSSDLSLKSPILSSFTLRLTSEDVFGPDEIDNVFDTGENLSVEDERPFSCDCILQNHCPSFYMFSVLPVY